MRIERSVGGEVVGREVLADEGVVGRPLSDVPEGSARLGDAGEGAALAVGLGAHAGDAEVRGEVGEVLVAAVDLEGGSAGQRGEEALRGVAGVEHEGAVHRGHVDRLREQREPEQRGAERARSGGEPFEQRVEGHADIGEQQDHHRHQVPLHGPSRGDDEEREVGERRDRGQGGAHARDSPAAREGEAEAEEGGERDGPRGEERHRLHDLAEYRVDPEQVAADDHPVGVGGAGDPGDATRVAHGVGDGACDEQVEPGRRREGAPEGGAQQHRAEGAVAAGERRADEQGPRRGQEEERNRLVLGEGGGGGAEEGAQLSGLAGEHPIELDQPEGHPEEAGDVAVAAVREVHEHRVEGRDRRRRVARSLTPDASHQPSHIEEHPDGHQQRDRARHDLDGGHVPRLDELVQQRLLRRGGSAQGAQRDPRQREQGEERELQRGVAEEVSGAPGLDHGSEAARAGGERVVVPGVGAGDVPGESHEAGEHEERDDPGEGAARVGRSESGEEGLHGGSSVGAWSGGANA
ncbi:MAG: hypothetical protein IPN17_05440 [Deltaproteobacteria bacterium]|nr:hypothetical protein [Deltaproteobacteria bacterium]